MEGRGADEKEGMRGGSVMGESLIGLGKGGGGGRKEEGEGEGKRSKGEAGHDQKLPWWQGEGKG